MLYDQHGKPIPQSKGEASDNNKPQHINFKRIAEAFLSVVCFGLFQSVSSMFFSTGYRQLGIWSEYFAFVSGTAFICLLFPTKLKRKSYYGFFIISLFFLIIFAWFSTWKVAEVTTVPVVTKQDIRTLLESINPQIIVRIDKGEKRIDVMVGDFGRTKLMNLSDRPGFANYLSFEKTGSVIMASRNVQMDDFINDKDDRGTLNGFIFYPKDALRK